MAASLRILGLEALPPDGPALRRAFLSSAMAWHPDRHVGVGPSGKAHAERKFREATEAYDALRACM